MDDVPSRANMENKQLVRYIPLQMICYDFPMKDMVICFRYVRWPELFDPRVHVKLVQSFAGRRIRLKGHIIHIHIISYHFISSYFHMSYYFLWFSISFNQDAWPSHPIIGWEEPGISANGASAVVEMSQVKDVQLEAATAKRHHLGTQKPWF